MIIGTLPRLSDNKSDNNPWRYTVAGSFGTGPEIANEYGFELITLFPPNCEEACRMCDGLLLPGSCQDILSTYWGEDTFVQDYVYDEYAHDRIVIDHFVKAGKPIFGVCGGLQALNVYFGGSLKHVITNENILEHRDEDEKHEIEIIPGSMLHDAFGTTSARVNSMHGWVIDRLAPSLTVTGINKKDGLIEAVENREMGIIATQWHPEQVYNPMAWVPEKYSDPREKKLFENFLALCEERKNKR